MDGPGIRFVVFTQGCPLRCLYCHNPDTWKMKGGEEYSPEQIIEKALRYKNYMGPSGGITITGGEPLAQPAFTGELLLQAKAAGLHTALDTSGFAPPAARAAVLPYADLVLLDIKSIDPEGFKTVAGVTMDYTLDTLNELKQMNTPVWVRHVIVPGLTDKTDEARRMAGFLKTYPNVEKVELLPFHKMGEFKWEELGEDYTLADTPTPSAELMTEIRTIFKEAGLPVD